MVNGRREKGRKVQVRWDGLKEGKKGSAKDQRTEVTMEEMNGGRKCQRVGGVLEGKNLVGRVKG